MENLFQKINDMNDLILQGKAMEAFEKYYHQDVEMQENEAMSTLGKDANRRREKEFYSSITAFRGARPLKIAIGESLTMVEWQYDYTHREWGVRNYKQVSIQQWKDGQIIHEKFYYPS